MNHPALPAGYRPREVMDFVRNRRQMKIVCYGALAATVVMVALGLVFHPVAPSWQLLRERPWAWAALAGMLIAYIPLHELTHGLLMRLLSGVHPKYGISLCYAYAGSTVWFDKRSHGIIALAPLVFWGAVLAILERALPEAWFWLIYLVQISNVSGSAGDVYCVVHLRKLPRDILIQDTGTRMRVYAPRSIEERK